MRIVYLSLATSTPLHKVPFVEALNDLYRLLDMALGAITNHLNLRDDSSHCSFAIKPDDMRSIPAAEHLSARQAGTADGVMKPLFSTFVTLGAFTAKLTSLRSTEHKA